MSLTGKKNDEMTPEKKGKEKKERKIAQGLLTEIYVHGDCGVNFAQTLPCMRFFIYRDQFHTNMSLFGRTASRLYMHNCRRQRRAERCRLFQPRSPPRSVNTLFCSFVSFLKSNLRRINCTVTEVKYRRPGSKKALITGRSPACEVSRLRRLFLSLPLIQQKVPFRPCYDSRSFAPVLLWRQTLPSLRQCLFPLHLFMLLRRI